jgi:DNA invertase Pin-like site-specific DNA recombinase
VGTAMSLKIGYARVSTEDQNLDLQISALREAGCTKVFQDKASGVDTVRKGLAQALKTCERGDVLVVWKLDRLGRSLLDLIGLVQQINGRGVGLRVLTGHGAMIDTTRAEGRMMFGLLAVLAEFERELIRERTKAGMRAAKQRGSAIGRPRKLSQVQIKRAKNQIASGRQTRERVAEQLGVHVTTLRRALFEKQ